MVDSKESGEPASSEQGTERAISIVQRGNLKSLEQTLRKQWRLGQNIVLCWSLDERGLLVIFVPHYFLGNYCADPCSTQGSDNQGFIRELISGRRRKTREALFAVCERLDVAPTFIKLKTPLAEEELVLDEVEQLIRRYGLSYVDNRAVILFDIVEFSLFTPFEQASQLNSLSYSLNSAYNKLLARGMEINFARTTTGDGYYVWNRSLGPRPNRELFYFMLLVVADNAVARAASRGNTVPLIRTGYHIGGHYELYQAEGVNPTMFSYIVGDVTIELARMVDLAQAGQILVGDFQCPGEAGGGGPGTQITAPAFISGCNRELVAMHGTQLSGKTIESLQCQLTSGNDEQGGAEPRQAGPRQAGPRRFRIVDKHGLSRHAYNLEIQMDLEDRGLSLGLDGARLPGRQVGGEEGRGQAPSADELIGDLATMLKKRSVKTITED
jgi:hypothetical protein